ncbi:MAG: hydroxyethylthiazole kinase [bacterium]
MEPLAEVAAQLLDRVRGLRPLVHHITNVVSVNDVANATLAAGALPVMAHAREEVEEVAATASALVLNLGTLTPRRVEAMLLAGRRAGERHLPVVLDPVGVGLSGLRADAAQRLLREVPVTAVRGNLAEMAHLAGGEGFLRGVESVGAASPPEEVAREVARRHHVVAAVTGPRDWVADGLRSVAVDNGHPWLKRVAGAGCMATGVVACFLAVADDPLAATAAALAYFGYAAERAARQASGPASFRVALLDQLARLEPEDLRAGVRGGPVELPSAPQGG